MDLIIKLTKLKLAWVLCLAVLVPVAYAKLSGSLSVDAIKERLKPMGQVNVIGTDAAAAPTAISGAKTPIQIYEQNCKMCHATGLAGAPKFGNKADWATRISQGLDTLVQTAWDGIRAMPPKGNCIDCTKEDIKVTVEYMIDAVK
jgi:cytochrome c5